MVLIRRIAELGAVSDSGGQTPQAHVCFSPPLAALPKQLRFHKGRVSCFHVSVSAS